ncbi:phosphoenolpyruvate hydrolase family protein [Pectinatus frisingensis]|uniref:phosphoenolpyruvate hydrolase family protein n=1 Tax=Pectinatus frisingensis TaxID=865 RepID=UPI003D804F05
MFTRKNILTALNKQKNNHHHIIGAVVGTGITAKYAAMGGADLLLALSAGKYRSMGQGSYASYYCYGNSNDLIMEIGSREILPMLKTVPVLFGLFASDPFINLTEYIKKIKRAGFSGIVNYPTLSLIDGKFREALEEDGNTFEQEIEAISLAHKMDMFTLAFVINTHQAQQMLLAGADIICLHLGLTKGGFLGAKKYISIDEARKISGTIFKVCTALNPDVIKMIYAGPANTPLDMEYIYQSTECQGYIGGSTFDRIPTEKAILKTIQSFKYYNDFEKKKPAAKIHNNWNNKDYADFIKYYIKEHYTEEIHLSSLASAIHVSKNYLSIRFKKEVGCSFSEYLVRFRVNKAKDLLRHGCVSCKEAAVNVGYTDYVQFSKMFKKYTRFTPSAFAKDTAINK